MKLTIDRTEWRKALDVVKGAVAGRSTTLPVLSHVHLKANAVPALVMTCSNLEIGLRHSVAATVEKSGEISVPLKTLYDLLSNLPDGPVEVEVKRSFIHLTAGRWSNKIKCLPGADFPEMAFEGDDVTVFQPDELARALSWTWWSASVDESRPMLTGLYLHVDGDGRRLLVAAADGFRLSVAPVMVVGKIDPDAAWLITAKPVRHLPSLILAQDEMVKMTTKKNQVGFDLGLTQSMFQRLDLQFPDYSQIVPANYKVRAVVEVAEMLQVVKQARIFAQDAADQVHLEMTPETIFIDGKSFERGDVRSPVTVVKSEGLSTADPFSITLNGRWLAQALDACGTDQISIEATTSDSPVVFRPEGQAEWDGYLHVQMPMFDPITRAAAQADARAAAAQESEADGLN